MSITSINVGDILTVTWGYDQTNVDFYQITRKTDKSVWTRSIECERTYTQSMSGKVVPKKDQFQGDEKRSLIQSWEYQGETRYSIKIGGRCSRSYNGTPEDFSSYA